MKNVRFKLLAGLMALLGATSLVGEGLSGRWYVAPKGSVNWLTKTKSSQQLGNASVSEQLKHKVGFGGGLAVGYAMDNNWRMELEGFYRQNKNKHVHEDVSVPEEEIRSTDADVRGKMTYWSVMANGFYDYAISDTAFKLYAGLGLGYSRAQLKAIEDDEYGKGKANLFAYQLMAGVGYDITENWTASLGYRLFSSFNKPKFKINGEKITAKRSFIHAIELGVRYTF